MAPLISKKFRKKKKTPSEIRAEREKLRQEEKERRRYLKELYGDDVGNDEPPVFILDGYNVLYEMMKQDKKRFEDKDFQERRSILEDDVHIFSQSRGVRCCIVYDAVQSPMKKDSRMTLLNVEIVFCSRYEADFGLIVESERYIAEGTSNVVIVTNDNLARDVCVRPPIITDQSSRMFVREMKICKTEAENIILENNLKPTNDTLRSTLPIETLKDLQEVRNALLMSED